MLLRVRFVLNVVTAASVGGQRSPGTKKKERRLSVGRTYIVLFDYWVKTGFVSSLQEFPIACLDNRESKFNLDNQFPWRNGSQGSHFKNWPGPILSPRRNVLLPITGIVTRSLSKLAGRKFSRTMRMGFHVCFYC